MVVPSVSPKICFALRAGLEGGGFETISRQSWNGVGSKMLFAIVSTMLSWNGVGSKMLFAIVSTMSQKWGNMGVTM